MSPVPTAAPPAYSDAALVTELRPALVAFFRRKIGNATEAEDLAQEVVLRALLHTGWKSTEQAKGYVFKIAMNCWRDRCRRFRAHGTEVLWDETSGEEVGTHNSPECVLEVREEIDAIAAAFEELNIRTRTVLMLVKLEQMRVATVAQLLGISVSAVNKHLAKGLAHLATRRIGHENR